MIDSGLDWIGRIFNPELFNNIWEKKKDDHYVSTLRAYRQDFDHHLEAHSTSEQIAELKKAIDKFIETNEVFQKQKNGLMHQVRNYYLRKRANIVYKKTHEILKHLK